MNYTPQTEVHLLSNVPFNFSYNNVMDFDTISDQTSYFLNKSKLTFEDLTHQRVNNNSINHFKGCIISRIRHNTY